MLDRSRFNRIISHTCSLQGFLDGLELLLAAAFGSFSLAYLQLFYPLMRRPKESLLFDGSHALTATQLDPTLPVTIRLASSPELARPFSFKSAIISRRRLRRL